MLVLRRNRSAGPCHSIPFDDVQWLTAPPLAIANVWVLPPANTTTGRPGVKFPPKVSIATSASFYVMGPLIGGLSFTR
jgi:hypothetical protein